ncbi:F-box protein At3g58530 [Nicotiana tomentosiformis]|nr:F-box protein At3g58530 [Nicotiana tomentosiformis]
MQKEPLSKSSRTMEEKVTAEAIWNKEIVPKVMKIVSTRLPQKELITLLFVSPWIHHTLHSHPSLWLVLDFHEMSNAGNRLVSALSLPRYRNVKHINLEFAQDIEDKQLEIVKSKCGNSLLNLEILNLNGCQRISDKGIEVVTSTCPRLKVFSIYWNVRVTDVGITHLVKNCRSVVDLNLSGCKNITDKSLHLVADNFQEMESLNITRCIKLTDSGLQRILLKCSSLQSLNLYALSTLTDEAYKKISLLPHLIFLDLCGAQNLTDDGLSCIAMCKNLVSLNLTWCVRVTDVGVIAIAQGCRSLELLSLFGILGVSDKCLEVLSNFCSDTLTTLDVNGCTNIKNRNRDQLLKLFPNLTCFKVHS